jgi:hypothetical protein
VTAKTWMALHMLALWNVFRPNKETTMTFDTKTMKNSVAAQGTLGRIADGQVRLLTRSPSKRATEPKNANAKRATVIAKATVPCIGTPTGVPCVGPDGTRIYFSMLDGNDADALLSHVDNFNRDEADEHIRTLARLMECGLFANYGAAPDAVAVAKGGELLNAYHRMYGLQASRKPQLFLVMDQCDAGIMDYIDGGRKRTNANRDKIINRRGNCELRQSIVGVLYDFMVSPSAIPGWAESEAFYHTFDREGGNDIEWTIKKVGNKVPITSAVLAAIVFAMQTAHRPEAARFAAALHDGSGGRVAPANALREFLLTKRLEKFRFQGSEVFRITSYAIRKHIDMERTIARGAKMPDRALQFGTFANESTKEKYNAAIEFFRDAKRMGR